MSFIKRIEHYDAEHGIPRPADAEHLPPYHAFLRCVRVGVEMVVLITCGVLSTVFLWQGAGYLGVTGQVWLMFISGMMMCLFLAIAEALQLTISYYRFKQRLTFGTARWAGESYLRNAKLAKRADEELTRGAIRIGKLKKKHDLILPVDEWLRHLVIWGPPGSGKSKTFLMNILRDVARGGSALVLDPKAELFQQTAHHFKRVYRLDLANPAQSDRWNFIPQCKDNPEFAHQMAATMIGIEGTRHTVADPFWGEAELVALTAILLELPLLVDEPTPPMVYEYTALRNDESFAADMMNSENHNVKLAWGAFTKAPKQTQGSVLTGLANKLHPFLIKNAQAVTAQITGAERKMGVQQINFKDLQKAGTAIYIVIPEGDASRYRAVLSTFIGQAVTELRNESSAQDSAPVLFVLDEAANVPLTGLKELAGVGRGRKMGLCLGYQNLPQVQDQYGHDAANAILGSIGTMIFLPGLDDSTTQYASRRIGQTTAWSHTTVDGPGVKYDNERNSETGRALMDPTELRQMVKHKQCIVLIDTSPPIKSTYLPYAVQKAKAVPQTYGEPRPVTLIEAEAALQERKAQQARVTEEAAATKASSVTLDTATLHEKAVLQNYQELVEPSSRVPAVYPTAALVAASSEASDATQSVFSNPVESKKDAQSKRAPKATPSSADSGLQLKMIQLRPEYIRREFIDGVTAVARERAREVKRTVPTTAEVGERDHGSLNVGREDETRLFNN
jgi:type IV secretory pathway TraG/TraD family ATPase VirD4